MVQEMRLKLKTYMDRYLELWDFYGVIQVKRRGETLFEGAYGYANIEFDIRNKMDSRFSLASVSKQFTAFAILLLHERRLVDIDSSAQLYLPPEMKIDDSITIHHLLSHTSGLYNFHNFENNFFGGYNRWNYSPIDFFRLYFDKEPAERPGIAYDYNNANYNLLAWIIEYVSGETYADFIRDHLFLPLGMMDSDVDDGCKPIRNKSSNYVRDFDDTVKCPYYNEKFSLGAGGVVSTSGDLYKWYVSLRDRKILSRESYARFFSRNKNNYCYGLEYSQLRGASQYGHGGDHLGISTYVQYDFDEDICILILSNNEAVNQYRLGEAVSEILNHRDVKAPVKHEEVVIDENKLQEYCGTYLKDKIEVERIDGKLYFTRFSGNLHIEIYPVGDGLFARRYSDQIEPYRFIENEKGEMTFFGYPKLD